MSTYAIGDIHGHNDSLLLILNEILPLKKDDLLVFLGDYIDRGEDSSKVIDTLCSISYEYPDQAVFLRGNHEWLMLGALGLEDFDNHIPDPKRIWMINGGHSFIDSYERLLGKVLDLGNLKESIPKEHLGFLLSTEAYHENDEYIFVHGGCDPTRPLEEQSRFDLMWNRSLYNFCAQNIGDNFEWEKPIICGHNYEGPVINPKFMMIDASASGRVMCLELETMDAVFADHDATEVHRENLKPATEKDITNNRFQNAGFRR